MIVQLLLSTVLILFFLGFGFIFQRLFSKINSSIAFVILNGMIGVGLLSFLLAFFIPLNLTYEVILICISILSLIYHRSELRKSVIKLRNISLYFYVFLFFGLLVSVTYPYILDHFGYYIPTIKWLDFAGFVKGLSNFEWILAQNSFWHILQASINESLDIYYRLNFCLFIVFNLYVFEFKNYKLLFLNALFLFFLNIPSPDLPVFILSILLINEYLEVNNKASGYLFYATILFVIKPISIVLLLFFGIEYLVKKEYKHLLNDKNVYLILFVALLFCSKGIIVSANPLFPISFTAIENLSWASPIKMYEISNINARFIPLKDTYSFSEVAKMNIFHYLKAILFQNSIRTFILLFIYGLTFILSIISFYKKNSFLRLLIICCWIKLIIMLFLSPQFRFLLDILIIDGVIILTIFNLDAFNRYSKIISCSCVFIVGIALAFPITNFKYFSNIKSFSYLRNITVKELVFPGNYETLTVESKKLGNLIYNYPIDYPLIYSAPPPAITNSSLNNYLLHNGYPQQINSANVKQGFNFVEMSESERKKIIDFLLLEQKKQAK